MYINVSSMTEVFFKLMTNFPSRLNRARFNHKSRTAHARAKLEFKIVGANLHLKVAFENLEVWS